VPSSVFVENTELYTTRSMTQTWQRIHGASTGGTPAGIHGNGIESVTVRPSGQQLSTDAETTIQSSTDLAFEVAVTNSGDFQEVGVAVTLTVPRADQPIVKNATIDLIEAGETRTVTFRDFPDPPFGEEVSVKVDVQPVEGETNTSNNTAEYPVVFSLG
jgi:subtilase family serine protease